MFCVNNCRPVKCASFSGLWTRTLWLRVRSRHSSSDVSCLSTELQGRTLKLQRRRGPASGSCKHSIWTYKCSAFVTNEKSNDFLCIPPTASVASSVLPVLPRPATRRELCLPTSSTTRPVSWRRVTLSPSSPEKSQRPLISSKRSKQQTLFVFPTVAFRYWNIYKFEWILIGNIMEIFPLKGIPLILLNL